MVGAVNVSWAALHRFDRSFFAVHQPPVARDASAQALRPALHKCVWWRRIASICDQSDRMR
jgi:hypothetical protein